jgi:hypothetical protein
VITLETFLSEAGTRALNVRASRTIASETDLSRPSSSWCFLAGTTGTQTPWAS